MPATREPREEAASGDGTAALSRPPAAAVAGGAASPSSDVPQPHELFARMRDEGMRRLSRSWLELASTALVAGFDVVFGLIALGAVDAAVTPRFGPELGHIAGALAFGIGFVFIVLGHSELFTENFMVPVAGLQAGRRSKLQLAKLWISSPVINIIGGGALILVVSSHGVLPRGTGHALAHVATGFDRNSAVTAFLSAIAGGALITLMTWLVEGVRTIGVRIVAAWSVGFLLAAGSFNHVIVVTLEFIFGIRFGADLGWLDAAQNFAVAAAGNMLGGLLFVTLTRSGQALGSGGGGRRRQQGPEAAG